MTKLYILTQRLLRNTKFLLAPDPPFFPHSFGAACASASEFEDGEAHRTA